MPGAPAPRSSPRLPPAGPQPTSAATSEGSAVIATRGSAPTLPPSSEPEVPKPAAALYGMTVSGPPNIRGSTFASRSIRTAFSSSKNHLQTSSPSSKSEIAIGASAPQ